MKNKNRAQLDKNQKSYTLWYIIVCFLIVIGSAQLMAMALESFENGHRVEAETLPELPKEINLNQITNLLNDGYLIDKPFFVDNK